MTEVPKGIFCIEGEWEDDEDHEEGQEGSNQSSVRAVLELMQNYKTEIETQYWTTVTKDSFMELLRMASDDRRKNFPIIYITLHGDRNGVYAGADEESFVTLKDMEKWSEDRVLTTKPLFNRKIVFFASCGTVTTVRTRMENFVKRTGALAVCGYSRYVDWMDATLLEASVLAELQRVDMRKTSMKKAFKTLEMKQPVLTEKLGFCWYT